MIAYGYHFAGRVRLPPPPPDDYPVEIKEVQKPAGNGRL
jgi:hypothetical protein